MLKTLNTQQIAMVLGATLIVSIIYILIVRYFDKRNKDRGFGK